MGKRSVGRVTVARIDIVQIEQGYPFEAWEKRQPRSDAHPFAGYEEGAAEAPRVEEGASCIRVVERSPHCLPNGTMAEKPGDAWKILRVRAQRSGHEELGILSVTLQGEAIGSPVLIATGQVSAVRVDVEQILAPAIKDVEAGSRAFWLWHTHGSTRGDEPSGQDKELTKTVRAAAKIAMPNTKFLGHIVIGTEEWSLA